jgi:hypothetical protein
MLFESVAQFRRADHLNVWSPFPDLSLQLRIDRYAHGEQQAPVVGDTKLLRRMPKVFLNVAGDFGIEEELDGFPRAAAVDA